MAITRLNTASDAIWARAWSVANAAERATLIATYLSPLGPKRGDIIFQVDTGIYYLVATANVLQQIGSIGTGDVVGPAASVASEIALYDGTTGKLIKRATGTGVVHATSGVYSAGNVALASEVSGTLPDGNLSANVPLLNAANSFSAQNVFTASRGVLLQRNQPSTELWDSSQAADARSILISNGGNTAGSLSFLASNDAHSILLALLEITRGGIVNLVNGQLQFPATQNASSNANTLDDYEEGTWTPVDSSGAALTFTYPISATYIKVGTIVFCTFGVVYPATASVANALIGGLPFTSTTNQGGAYCFYTDLGVLPMCFVGASDTKIQLFNVATAVSYTNINLSGKDIRLSVIYTAST